MVWEVEAGDRGVGGVTDNLFVAQKELLDALYGLGTGRGRMRYARLSFIHVGYVYGPIVVTAHRKDGVTVLVAGGTWESTL
ncbi:hypothetical protein DP939_42255 [Spongiactinospora rosea]|uniref:Uncharacterized protein n=1 Tax=Spongiactinospora rosea TaxID=2248750 RepID=A0A366LJW0_9ACTN|nr:hypothetical protein [Spongiactinospora rosea]RBQ14175.1 hypothetical protein DP939_42255 [Spongiactinospora rosea]